MVVGEEQLDVVIVGSGWNGLIAATTYLRLAPETNLLIIDDGKSIGGVWSKEKIYPNLFAQIGYGLFEYSFYPMKNVDISPDRYIPGTTIHNYLNDFARDYDLVRRIRLETTVTNVERLDKDGWRLSIAGAPSIRTEKLIYATGATSYPYVPSWPKENFTRPIIHSSQTGTSLDELKRIKRATVVGAAKSSYDTVFLLLKQGVQVDWIIREDGTGPLAIMPPRLFGMFNTVDVMATRAMASFSPAIMSTKGIWYKFLHKTKVGRAVTKTFWRNVTRVAEWHAGYSKSPNARKLRPIPFGYGIFWANAGLGLASVPHFWKTFHAGKCAVHRTEIASFSHGNRINLANGIRLNTDYVILCTGFTHNLNTFSKDLRAQYGLPINDDLDSKWAKLDAQGELAVNEMLPLLEHPPITNRGSNKKRPSRLYRWLVSPSMAARGDRSIYFPGLIHSVYTPLVAELQALWGVAFMLGRLDLPDQEVMEREVATWNAWTRKRYLEQGRKHAYAIYDYIAYIDTLARDLGINNKRKSNFVAEMFAPYRPSDYRGLIEEFLDAEAKRKVTAANGNVREANGKAKGKFVAKVNGYANGAASSGAKMNGAAAGSKMNGLANGNGHVHGNGIV